MDYSGWNVFETQFDPAELHHKETLFTLGNGYLGTRGSFEEGYPNTSAATLINGVYDDVPVMHTELVNCPDWLPLTVYIGSDRFCLSQGEILDYQRQLDLRWGIVSRDVLWRSPGGHTVKFHFERMISMADDHVLVLHCQITPVDFTGAIAVEASINGNVDNHGVKHWDWLEQGGSNNNAWLHQRCSHSKIELGMAFQLACSEATTVKLIGETGSPTLTTTFQAQPGKTVTLEKIVTVFTSLEANQPVSAAQERLASLPSYTTLLAAHGAVWDDLWQDCDIAIAGDSTAQIAVRYNLFQILAAAPRHNNRVSIPAKTLSGFAYRGHVFWDTEVFIVPFFTFTQPQIARNLLSYRYHTLEGARRKAQAAGYEGAMYAWESANTGDEVTPRWVFGPDGEPVRIWCGDIEVHINTDIAYAVWHYWQATHDDNWMQREGAEIVLDTAVFWGSRVEWNGDRQCYEIRDVIGPDENHERVDNNTFTNRMAQWHLERALAVYNWLHQHYPERAAELAQKLDIRPERTKRWSHIIRHMLVVQPTETNVIEQFEGFFDLEDIDWTDYQWRTQSMQAILGVEGTNEKQILKQPDILMLLYLLRDTPVKTEMTAQQRRQLLQANWDYYTPRTDHTYGSSLGPAIHAILACELDEPTTAYEHFMRAALVDIKDVRGNAGEGVHAASAGGIWQAVVFGFAGVRLTEAGPIVDQSHLPSNWTRLQFKLQWRQRWYKFDISPDAVIMTTQKPEVSGISSEGLNQVKPNMALSDRCTITPLRGVIFDLDGVLTDTSEYHYLAWKQLADEIGIAFNRQANEQMRGLSRRDSLLHMLGDCAVSEAELQEMMVRKNSYYEQLIQNLTPADLLPGALALLDELQAADIKVAIGSSSKNARLVCQRLGIAERLNAIADGYSVEHHKPAPDVFLYAASQLGLLPHECLVVEDAGSGVAAGLAARMWVLGLGPVERVGDAHIIRDNLAGLNWQQLLVELEQSQTLVCSES
ncbi:beta-phosphoglucomutase [Gloeocapsopsis sp. IPPAS B-1203]|uniref:beta-phosphoglucomutase n=1 Tax=Gloeocapsopsis sp. IPPAS B-1203 TaxID=2049454 RepID=UPI000C17892E|nr:beta-phosphoglucomutase [Gloeocapsopsis sp. IPPAS B-1203]PIG94972.1 beta-phosphoglucomutase [Gloeocapsopsis sp. IPPAS B-1203]